MQPARTDHQHRGIVADLIALAAVGIGEAEAAEPIGLEVRLALDQLVPGRRGRVLEVGHERARAGVERVDHHLGVGRPGDLDAAVLQVGGDASDRPVRLADVARVLAEVGNLARVEPLLPVEPAVEQLAPPAVESLVQFGNEVERIRGQDCARPGYSTGSATMRWPVDH